MSIQHDLMCASFCVFRANSQINLKDKERNFTMNNPDRKANLAVDALVFLLALALLTFITRLWPILLLVILGIFVAALRLVFLSAKQAPKEAPQLLPAQPVRPTEPEPDLEDMIFEQVCARVTLLVRRRFPNANWIWELPDAKRRILDGQTAGILLNQAGGYRRGEVRLNLYRVDDIVFPEPTAPEEPAPEPESAPEEHPDPEPQPQENYELLAFEWVEAHILELNNRCNEAVGSKRSTLLLKADELPQKESWPAICAELAKQDIQNTACRDEGIWIQLDGGAAA